jgi:hypothetical protein
MDKEEILALPEIDSAVDSSFVIPVVSTAGNDTLFRATVGDLPAGGSGTFTTLRAGVNPENAYPVEMGQDYLNVASDLSFMRIKVVAERDTVDPGSFLGVTALRIEVEDDPTVVEGTDPYLYGIRVRVVPRITRLTTAVDDIVGINVGNKSFGDLGTTFRGTEAFYVAYGGDPANTQEWNTGYAVDTAVGKAFLASRGPIDYGFIIDASTVVNQHAVAIPNNTKISSRNQANGAWLEMLRLDTNNVTVLGGNATARVAVGTPAVALGSNFEVHGVGVADGATLLPQMRVVDTSALAINNGGEIALGGLTDAVPTYRTYAAIKSGKENATSGNRAGYLALWTGDSAAGLVERMRISSTGVVSLPANGIVGGFFELNELTGDPANGAANTARLYAKDNGAGKTQIIARFPTGAAVVIATEP